VSEACIVSIPDKDASTRIAAVVRFQSGCYGNLATIREALSDKLAQYKLPTALRVLGPDEEIPATVIGKVIRRKVVQRYFASGGTYELPANVEVWDINQKPENPKAWDWAGLQGC
jgi:acyl-CoA synthetase (AMP-forming)/AMP-acid ligase II